LLAPSWAVRDNRAHRRSEANLLEVFFKEQELKMPSLSILFPSETGDAAIENLEVTQIGINLYRIEEDICSFLIAETEEELDSTPRYGDIIHAAPVEKGTIRFISVYERAPMKRYDFILGEEIVESDSFHSLHQEIIDMGGHVERHFGGMLLISIPDEVHYDPTEAIHGLRT
jgi:hypothetical protein